MAFVLKTIAALCIGVGALFGAQRLWLSAIEAQVKAVSQTAAIAAAPVVSPLKFDSSQVTKGLMPMTGRIDTTAGQRAAIESAARRADIERRNALSHVPLPPRYPGAPFR